MTISTQRLADILLQAPSWACMGLTAPDERLRGRAADTLALVIAERLELPERPVRDERQMTLPIA